MPPIPSADFSSMEPQVAAKIRQAEQAVRQDPRSAANWGRLGMTFQAHTLFGPAARCYQAAFVLAPSDYRWAYLEALSVRSTDLQSALRGFRAAAQLQPENAAFYVHFGDALLGAGEVAEAETQYRQALKQDPQSSHALYGLAQIELTRGEAERALAHLEQAVSSSPRQGELYTLLGQVYRRLGREEEARQAAVQSQAYPGPTAVADPVYSQVQDEAVSSGALTQRGLALARGRQYAQAEEVFRKVMEIRAGNARDYVNLGAALAGQGRLEEAVELYRQALQIQPDEAFAHHNLSLALAKMGKADEALEHSRQAVRISPTYAEAYEQIGLLLEQRHQTEEAISNYREALRLDPGLGSVRNNLGKVLASQGQIEQAVEQWRQAVSIDPSNLEALHNLSIALALAGNHAQAIRHLEEGLRQAPNSSLFVRALAWELCTAPQAGLRDGARAVQLSERLYSNYPDRPQAADLRAAALAESGNFQEAQLTARRALQQALAANQPALAAQIRQRLQLYQQRRPYRQPR